MSERIHIVHIPTHRRDNHGSIADNNGTLNSNNNTRDNNNCALPRRDTVKSLSVLIEDDETIHEEVEDECECETTTSPNGVLPSNGGSLSGSEIRISKNGMLENNGSLRGSYNGIRESNGSLNGRYESNGSIGGRRDTLGSLNGLPPPEGWQRRTAIITLSRRMQARHAQLNTRRKSSILLSLGRDFESVYTNHRYTPRERDLLASHDSFDYLPSHSVVYTDWLRRQPSRLDWDRWIMMGLIGTTIGIIGFLMHQTVHLIAEIKWEKTNHFIHDNLLKAWGWLIGYSVLFTSLSSASVAFFCLPAGGSGIPEVVGFLNGTMVRHVFTLRTLAVKFFSCICAVGAGLPVGPEGPMIHIGSVVGSGLSQLRSRTLKISLPWFSRFRNSEDRRNFTTAGAAAGVASAFTAPVGGLLFAMEEVSSFWSMKLGWMIFFACMLATFTTDLFNAAFHSFRFNGVFGLFQTDKFIIFKLGNAIPVNVVMFIPAVILGFIGGVFGAIFTITNLKINRTRRRLIAKIKKPIIQRLVRFFEPILIMIVWGTIVIYLPAAFPCKPVSCPQSADTLSTVPTQSSHEEHVNFSKHKRDDSHISTNPLGGARNDSMDTAHASYDIYAHDNHINSNQGDHSHGNHNNGDPARDDHGHGETGRVDNWSSDRNASMVYCPKDNTPYAIDDGVKHYWCLKPILVNGSLLAGDYNEVASLLNLDGQSAIRLLFSRRTHLQFGYESLLTVLALYYFMACWAAGSAVASGIVVPMLFIGGLYGRAMGRLLVDIHGGIPTSAFWKWIDPGAMALIGSASFFGGVSRLTMSLTVIMIEITNDVAFLLPIMVAIMVAKWVGDYITHPLYHSLLEMKCIPFLDSEPVIYDEQQNLLNLELFKARDVMHSPVITLTSRESAAHLAHLLLETSHGGFPIVKYHEDSRQEVAYGLITRTELCLLLCDDKVKEQQHAGVTITPEVAYEQISTERIPDCINMIELLERYVDEPHFKEVYVDIDPFINKSAPHIEENFSLHRTYIVFRTLGLRHINVVDMANRIVGIISRKDLMGFNLEEKLEQRKRRGYSLEGGIQKLLPSEQSQSDPHVW